MKEEFLHYIWQYGLYQQASLKTSDQQIIRVVNPGKLNYDSGPDFQGARVYVGSTLWVGHVEIHLKASEWFTHKHHQDSNYDQVILHLVYELDAEVTTTSGIPIPAAVLVFDKRYYASYQNLCNSLLRLPCESAWKNIHELVVEQAITAMAVESLEARLDRLSWLLQWNKGGWRDLFIQILFRGFGFGKNQTNFELLGRSLGHKLIDKHRHNIFQLESLLFGQAGLIPSRPEDVYARALSYEFKYLRSKYRLKMHPEIRWQVMRTRPANHPCLRLAQLAAWLTQNEDYYLLFSQSKFDSKIAFQASISAYWRKHSNFGTLRETELNQMSKESERLLNINVGLPLKAFFQNQHGCQQAIVHWLEALEEMAPENNAIIHVWKRAGFQADNALYTQAYLYLFRHYCQQKKCLSCQLGKHIVSQ